MFYDIFSDIGFLGKGGNMKQNFKSTI